MTDPMPLDEPIQEPALGKVERPASQVLLQEQRQATSAQDEIKRLARLPPLEYEHRRKQAADELGIDWSCFAKVESTY